MGKRLMASVALVAALGASWPVARLLLAPRPPRVATAPPRERVDGAPRRVRLAPSPADHLATAAGRAPWSAAGAVTLTGRVRYGDAPFVERRLWIEPRDPRDGDPLAWVELDASGRFEARWELRDEQLRTPTLRVVLVPADNGGLALALERVLAPPGPAGRVALGDLEFVRQPLVANVRVVDPGGQPVVGARLRLLRHSVDARREAADDGRRALRDLPGRYWTDVHGRAALHPAVATGEALVLEASASGRGTLRSEPFVPPAEDLRLVLRPGACPGGAGPVDPVVLPEEMDAGERSDPLPGRTP